MAATTLYNRQLLTTATETNVLTSGSNGAVITHIAVSNVTSSAVTILLTLHDSGTTKVALLPTVSIPGNSMITFDIKQPLGPTKSVFATAGTSNSLALHVAGVNF
jgi:hypothetical protein